MICDFFDINFLHTALYGQAPGKLVDCYFCSIWYTSAKNHWEMLFFTLTPLWWAHLWQNNGKNLGGRFGALGARRGGRVGVKTLKLTKPRPGDIIYELFLLLYF